MKPTMTKIMPINPGIRGWSAFKMTLFLDPLAWSLLEIYPRISRTFFLLFKVEDLKWNYQVLPKRQYVYDYTR